MAMSLFKLAAIACSLPLISACIGIPSIERRIDDSERNMQIAGFQSQWIQTNDFRIKTYTRHAKLSNDLHIYIQGDGLAYIRHNRVSSNPTPTTPLAQHLAALDRNASVIVLARPCQYETNALNAPCRYEYWTTHRYNQKVIDSMQAVLNQSLLAFKPEQKTHLGIIGYSGGGVIAALLASQRNDISWLATVAANLDTETWTQYHGDSPLVGSENPVKHVSALKDLPQIHWLGGQDKIIPESVTNSYLNALASDKAKKIVIGENNHHCCWEKSWPNILIELKTLQNTSN